MKCQSFFSLLLYFYTRFIRGSFWAFLGWELSAGSARWAGCCLLACRPTATALGSVGWRRRRLLWVRSACVLRLRLLDDESFIHINDSVLRWLMTIDLRASDPDVRGSPIHGCRASWCNVFIVGCSQSIRRLYQKLGNACSRKSRVLLCLTLYWAGKIFAELSFEYEEDVLLSQRQTREIRDVSNIPRTLILAHRP